MIVIIKPILFNTQMVKAILEGRKNTTRRLVKAKSCGADGKMGVIPNDTVFTCIVNGKYVFECDGEQYFAKPPCQIGDILYVRETWREIKAWTGSFGSGCEIEYKAGGTKVCQNHNWKNPQEVTPWIPSIHMPKEAARIWLKVVDVRIERLQDIKAADAYAEGIVYQGESTCFEILNRFGLLWDSTVSENDKEKCGWRASPWVWVIRFERCEAPE